MSPDSPRKPRKPLLVNLAWCAALLIFPLVYVLSYAPVYRWKCGATPLPPAPPPRIAAPHEYFDFVTGWSSTRSFQELSFYYPVDLLIDHTPLREPLFWWAGLFGVRADFQEGYNSRSDWLLMDEILQNAGARSEVVR